MTNRIGEEEGKKSGIPVSMSIDASAVKFYNAIDQRQPNAITFDICRILASIERFKY